jgi:glutamate-1-semialdehyde 2,1-aminomutase
MCAMGPNIIGYNHPKITEAAINQLKQCTVLSCASPLMIDLAEQLVDIVSIADWALFCKNGADVTALAALVARKATGRQKLILINGGYHGSAPWMQPPGMPGVLDDDHRHIIFVDWNDLKALKQAVSDYPGNIAGFMSSPYYMPTYKDNELPADGYWQSVEQICRKEGIVLIVDDVRCGFRLDLAGSNEYFGFKPDLICFSKAIANGYPLSALVGTDALKEDISSVMAMGTFWYEASAIAASLATLTELKKVNSATTVLEKGKNLVDGMKAIAVNHGYQLKITGAPSMPFVRVEGDDEHLSLSSEWCGECTKRGTFFVPFHNWFLSTAHTEEDISRTLEIMDDAFKAIKNKQKKAR